jgi:isopenicillin N synthase-like dioxygenase
MAPGLPIDSGVRSQSQTAFEIPIIDISPYLSGDLAQTSQIVKQLRCACEAPGFFQIIGHGVSSDLRTDLLKKLASFFELPATTKQALHRNNSKCLRGYESVGEQKLEAGFSDQKEGFMIGPEFPADARFLQGPNQWPREDCVPGLTNVSMSYFAAVHELSKMMFRLIALSLDLDEKFFDGFVGSEDCMFPARSPFAAFAY